MLFFLEGDIIKVLVISDIHGHKEDILKVIQLHPSLDEYVCLGDSCLDDISIFSSVKGNCDFFLNYPLFKDINTPYGIMHLEHGNLFRDDESIKMLNCKIFLSGHTHRRDVRKIDDIYIFNPGSLSKPRDGHKSYLILDIQKDKVLHKFYDLKEE